MRLQTDTRGAIAIVTLLTISVFALAVVTTMGVLTVEEAHMSSAAAATEQTFFAAEAGLNEALRRLSINPVPGPFTFTIDTVNVDVTVTTAVSPNPCTFDPDLSYPRVIESRATDLTGKIRTVRLYACSSAYSGGFDYAVQGGSGGIYMDPNSFIIGKVYSNGGITGGNNAEIRKLNSGDGVHIAQSNTLDNVDVEGDVHARTIRNSILGGKAYYRTVAGTVRANTTDNCVANENGPNCFDIDVTGLADPTPKNLPISDADVQKWRDEIDDAGNPNAPLGPSGGACPAQTHCVTGTVTLGRQKIEGNLYLGIGSTLILNGNLWVTGNVHFDNNGTVQLSNSLGGGSAVVIVEGTSNVENNLIMQGNGDPRSFLLFLSTNASGLGQSCSNPGTIPAVHASNNSDSIIFGAIHGLLKVKNNGHLNAAAVEQLCLENGASVTFNPNIAAFTVPSGGGDELGVALGTWQEN